MGGTGEETEPVRTPQELVMTDPAVLLVSMEPVRFF